MAGRWKYVLLFVSLILAIFPLTMRAQVRCDVDHRIATEWDAVKLEQMEQTLRRVEGHPLPRSTVTLPVVFHVVFYDDVENISDLQIRSQIDVLNRDFADASDNFYNVPEPFRILGEDSNIRFCLASTDPDGHPTNGITRTQTVVRNIGSHREINGKYSVHYDVDGGKNGWDPTRYINIWVAGMDGILGTASMPGIGAPEEDGIVVDPRFVGAISLAGRSYPFDRGHTLSHEMGHYFGLYHVWGPGNGGCQEDDFVDDTPLQNGPYINCPEYPQFSCGSSDMFMNFMDYTDDHCLALFTKGQIERMQAALTGLRSSLLDNTAACDLSNTGKETLNDALIFYSHYSGQIIIEYNDANAVRNIEVYSIDGKSVNSTVWDYGSVYWMDTDGIPAGMYIVRLSSGGKSITHKLFVSH